MAVSNEDSRIVVSFKPSLSYMCLAKIAVGLYNEFGIHILKKAFPEMKTLGLLEYKKCSPESFTFLCDRAKERLLAIPKSLREGILEAVDRVDDEMLEWIETHEKKVPRRYYYGRCTFFWISDGTIDRTRTAEEIVLNENVDTGARFEIACMYCLVKSVKTLWAVLEANGATGCYERPYDESNCNAMVHFWVRWLREGAQFHWTLAAHEYLDFRMFVEYPYGSEPSFSTLFRVLPQGDRCKFFKNLFLCDSDDLRFCLYTVTNKEQEEIMKFYAFNVLKIHTVWPLSSLFLEIAKKSWKFLNPYLFYRMLYYLLRCRDRINYDYYEYLAIEFWNLCPAHLKEHKGTGRHTVFIPKKTLKFIEKINEKKRLL